LLFLRGRSATMESPSALESFKGSFFRTSKAYVLVIRVFGLILLASVWHTGFVLPTTAAEEPLQADLAYYKSNVLPILREHCFECHSHSAKKSKGGLMLDSSPSMLIGGDSGPAIEPSKPEASLLVEAIRYEEDSIEMPPAGKLSDSEIEILVEWIRRGAPAPTMALSPGASSTGTLEPLNTESDPSAHWAFLPLKPPALPSSINEGPDTVDYLLEQKRRAAGVDAVPAASLQTVVQRLYSDLHGLPVEPAELQRILSKDTPRLEDIVDDLLSKPEFGERWGRHWLDVARYADSNGCSIESNNTQDNAWRYRDYVITSMNNDKPHDRFVVEQIAGDLLDYVSVSQRCEQLIATGFLVMGPMAFGTGFDQLHMDVIDEQIDTVGKAMLGMSLGCARCHDHKFDPVSTEDYYALAGIFASTQSVERIQGWRQGKSWHRVELPVLDSEATNALKRAYEQTKADAESGDLVKRAESATGEAKQRLEELRNSPCPDSKAISQAEEELRIAERELLNARNMKKVLPVVSPVPVAMAVAEKAKPVDESVRIRGEVNQLGDVVPRRVLPLLDENHVSTFRISPEESGRLQLARWLVDPEHGVGRLLARVTVNRIWGHLFARPLVDSPDNFGLMGAAPSQPELLDYLALRFIESGWSTKSLIRDIVCTKTYGLATVEQLANSSLDPENRWLWRYQPKRLDVEAIRDSMLAISGNLDRTRGGKTLQHLGLVSLGGDHLLLDAPSPYQRRSVYIPVYRDTVGLTDDVDASMGMLVAFNFADPNMLAGAREQSVVPAQTLFLMNADFVYEQAHTLAAKSLAKTQRDERVDWLFQRVYGRAASTVEKSQILEFVDSFVKRWIEETEESDEVSSEDTAPGEARRLAAWTSVCQSLFGSNEFLFLD
jgi:cytochrome c553